jgi:hypothetical protein
MFVRAKNRYDAYDLMNAGMLHVYRETIDTSLRLGVDVMKILGHKEFSARRAAKKFSYTMNPPSGIFHLSVIQKNTLLLKDHTLKN